MLSRECRLLGASLGVGELVFVLWDYSVCCKTYLPYGVILCCGVYQCVTEYVLSLGSLYWMMFVLWGVFVWYVSQYCGASVYIMRLVCNGVGHVLIL